MLAHFNILIYILFIICKSLSCAYQKNTELDRFSLTKTENDSTKYLQRVEFWLELSFERQRDCNFRFKSKISFGVSIRH